MATPDEIRRRVEQADIARGAARSVAAQQVGDLAQRRAVIAEQLNDIERQLGDVLAAAQEVMDVGELAQFTDVPAADLTRWLTARTARKTSRIKGKRSVADAAAAASDASRRPSAARSPTAGPASTLPEPAVRRANAVDAPARVPAEVA
jgi:hypothetical protein